jgi:hypothetical protein
LTDNTFELICDEITGVQRTKGQDLMHIKIKKLSRKENRRIQNIDIESSQGSIIVDQRHVLNIWDSFVTEL